MCAVLNETTQENSEECHILDCQKCNLESLIEKGWFEYLHLEVNKSYFQEIKKHLHKSAKICPPINQIFSFTKHFNLEDTKVVIVGQDPYHGFGQANGLAFSVYENIKAPPSLKNIYKEILKDFNKEIIDLKTINGDLTAWSKQGVLLINSSLTVEDGKPNSHKHFKWNLFTDEIIKQISKNCENVVFLLWGNFAISKKELIGAKHYIITSTHPSPFSYNKGFKGSGQFKKVNEFLEKTGRVGINWLEVIKNNK